MKTQAQPVQSTTLHVFHAVRDTVPGQPAFELAAIVTLPPPDDTDGNVEEMTAMALNQAVSLTNNISGSWSLKMGPDAAPGVAPQKLIATDSRIVGARSTYTGDVIVLGGARVFRLEPFGFAEEKPSAPSSAITSEAMAFLLEQSNAQPSFNPLLDSAHVATQVASFLGIHHAASALAKLKPHVAEWVHSSMTQEQVDRLMDTAFEVAGDYADDPAYRDQVTTSAYSILDRHGQQEGGDFNPRIEAMLGVLNTIEERNPRQSTGMRL